MYVMFIYCNAISFWEGGREVGNQLFPPKFKRQDKSKSSSFNYIWLLEVFYTTFLCNVAIMFMELYVGTWQGWILRKGGVSTVQVFLHISRNASVPKRIQLGSWNFHRMLPPTSTFWIKKLKSVQNIQQRKVEDWKRGALCNRMELVWGESGRVRLPSLMMEIIQNCEGSGRVGLWGKVSPMSIQCIFYRPCVVGAFLNQLCH